MAITNGYADLPTARRQAGILSSSDTADDARLESIVTAVSRHIDDWTGRRFYTSTADETRYFTADCEEWLDPGDLLSVTKVRTDASNDRTYGSTWASTDYELDPPNAALESQPQPYTRIYTTPGASFYFPAGVRRGVQVTGKWGYSATTPDVVREACLIQVGRVFKRRDSPFGIAGNLDLGTIKLAAQLDPDVKELLMPLRRITIA